MKKLGLLLCITLTLALSACGKTEDTNVANTQVPTQAAENNSEGTAEATKAPTAEPTEAAPDVCVMEEAPLIRNSISEEEKLTRQTAILEKGTFLFSDTTNKGKLEESRIYFTLKTHRNRLIALENKLIKVKSGAGAGTQKLRGSD